MFTGWGFNGWGHVWLGVCMVGRGMYGWGNCTLMVGKRAVRILLGCCLVFGLYFTCLFGYKLFKFMPRHDKIGLIFNGLLLFQIGNMSVIQLLCVQKICLQKQGKNYPYYDFQYKNVINSLIINTKIIVVFDLICYTIILCHLVFEILVTYTFISQCSQHH